MIDGADERDMVDDVVRPAHSEEKFIARVAADRRAGRDTIRGVRALLKLAEKANRAALVRLAR